MRCLEGTSVGLRERQTSANLTLRQLGGNGSRLIAPECVTPTRVEPRRGATVPTAEAGSGQVGCSAIDTDRDPCGVALTTHSPKGAYSRHLQPPHRDRHPRRQQSQLVASGRAATRATAVRLSRFAGDRLGARPTPSITPCANVEIPRGCVTRLAVSAERSREAGQSAVGAFAAICRPRRTPR
jgi:hypothetical protein